MPLRLLPAITLLFAQFAVALDLEDYRLVDLSHQIAGERNVLGLENLTGLAALPEKGAMLIALPMKIGGGSGGPARVIALVPRHTE